MAILRYVPPTKKIVDNRKPEGGYYEAECEVCGTKYYPERSNAKYCTPNCGLIAHRIAVANGTAEKRSANKPKPSVSEKYVELTGRKTVIGWLYRNDIRTHGLGVLLKSLEIGKRIDWEDVLIKRISMSRYRLLNNS